MEYIAFRGESKHFYKISSVWEGIWNVSSTFHNIEENELYARKEKSFNSFHYKGLDRQVSLSSSSSTLTVT